MKPAIIILYVWMALLTGWAGMVDIKWPDYMNAKHKSMNNWSKGNSQEIDKIWEYLEKIPMKRQ